MNTPVYLLVVASCLLCITIQPAEAATALQSGVQVSGTASAGVMSCYSYTITSQTTEAMLLPDFARPASSSKNLALYIRHGSEPTTGTYDYKNSLSFYRSKGFLLISSPSATRTYLKVPLDTGVWYYCLYSTVGETYTLTVTAQSLDSITLKTDSAITAEPIGSSGTFIPLYLPIASLSSSVAYKMDYTKSSMGSCSTFSLVYVDSSAQKSTASATLSYVDMTATVTLTNQTSPALSVGGYSVGSYCFWAKTFDLWLCTSPTDCTKPTGGGGGTTTPTPVPGTVTPTPAVNGTTSGAGGMAAWGASLWTVFMALWIVVGVMG